MSDGRTGEDGAGRVSGQQDVVEPGPRTLAALSVGRGNNLNLIRMTAAAAVLVSHAYPLTRGPEADQPLQGVLGFPLGLLAVYTFFIISGLLISQSFDRRRSVLDFILARVLRIGPALAVVLLLTVVVLGPAATTLPVGDYFHRAQTLSYWPRNLSLAFMQYGLPGVFTDNPYPDAINGSLWSLFYEVVCYGGVLAAGLATLRLRCFKAFAFVGAFAAAYAAVAIMEHVGRLPPKVVMLQQMSFPFFTGMLFWRLRDRIPLGWPHLVLAWAAVGVMAATHVVFEPFILAWAYIVLYLAYAPKTPLLAYNRLGDFSYGFYILAFPIQQLAVHWGLAPTPYADMLWAAPATLVLAVISWRMIEEPMIKARRPIVGALGRFFAPRRAVKRA
jgi:peptidoglycan/LPS O-acetylase OafA/YrhL